MGAKAWFIAYFDDDPKAVLSNQPKLDRNASRELAERLFPDVTLTSAEDVTLEFLDPQKDQIIIGCYGGVRIVAHYELSNDRPSKIDPRWFDPALGTNAYVHATHSVVDWFAYGLWRNGKLARALSISPDDGIAEQIGDPLPFEKAYWDGQFPVDDDDDEGSYPLPFHPLELSEASILHHLGFQFEGQISEWICDPIDIPAVTFAMKSDRPFWKFW